MKRNILLSLIAVLSLFLVVGCGNKQTGIQDNIIDEPSSSENNNKGTTSDNNTSTNTEEEDVKLYSDDTKIVFENGGGRIVYYYEGDTITGYVVYLDYSDNSTANFALSAMDWENDNSVKNAYVQGKYVVVEYNESMYENDTVSDIRTLYSYLKEVQKDN